MRTFGSFWSFAVFFVTVLVGCPLAALLLVVTLPFDRRRYVVGRFFRLMGVFIVKLNPLWRFSVRKPLPPYRPRRTVVVSNHVSNSDIFLISHLPWEMKWLAKASLFPIPLLGWLMWLAGDVPVHRGERDSAKAAMARLRQYLDLGMAVMIFPEGTRSRTSELLPFREGAFRLAIEAGADVLPIAITGTREALEKRSWRLGPSRGVVAVGTPIATGPGGIEDPAALSNAARAQIVALSAELELAASRA